ncbi:MAG: hypothetical protein WBD69_05890, partial [Candidatus Cybelea sp.]
SSSIVMTPPNASHAIELWGYSTTDRRFNAVILDNFGGTRDFSSSGWAGDAFVLRGVYVVGDTLTCVRET